MAILTNIPKQGELIIAKGCHKSYPFICVGSYQERNGKKRIFSMMGEEYLWNEITSWRYISEVLPDFDVWGPAVTPSSIIGLTLDVDDSEAYCGEA